MNKKLFLIVVVAFIFSFCAPAHRDIIIEAPKGGNISGFSLIEQGKLKEAEKFFMEEEDPFLKNIGLGYIALRKGKLILAEERFEKAEEYEKESPVLALGFAQLYEMKKNDEKALLYYKKAFSFLPESSRIKIKIDYLKGKLSELYLKKLLKEKDQKKWITIAEKLLLISPDIKDVREELIKKLYLLKDYKKVVSVYRGFEEPPSPDVRFMYIKSLQALSLYREALKFAESLYQDFPENSDYEKLYYYLKEKVKEIELPVDILRFKKKKYITREEFSMIVWTKLGDFLEGIKEKPVIIVDIGNANGAKFLKKLAWRGLLQVGRSHMIYPKNIVKRYELAKFSYRIVSYFRIKVPYKKIKIKDVPVYNVNYRAIYTACTLKLLNLNSGMFFPLKAVSGKELLDFIFKLEILLKER